MHKWNKISFHDMGHPWTYIYNAFTDVRYVILFNISHDYMLPYLKHQSKQTIIIPLKGNQCTSIKSISLKIEPSKSLFLFWLENKEREDMRS